ncbi:hypothetical protein RFJ32_005412 [Klebsiella pneumoniae]|nr:hypothetical protein [Klebsiella pneumoniae]
MFAGKKSAQIREILISESAWEEMTCLFAPSLIKSYGNEKTKIFLRGVNEVLMIDASFEEVKFAINNDLQDLQGMQAVSAPLKIAT